MIVWRVIMEPTFAAEYHIAYRSITVVVLENIDGCYMIVVCPPFAFATASPPVLSSFFVRGEFVSLKLTIHGLKYVAMCELVYIYIFILILSRGPNVVL